MFNELLMVFSEILLSAYPLLIKLVDVSVFLQTGLRMGVYSLLAYIVALLTGIHMDMGRVMSMESMYAGLLNLVHVFVSYYAFEALSAGNAMALFYTYPVFNILGAWMLLKEKISFSSLPWIALSLAGAVALAQPTATNWTLIGVICALLAAITESAIYLWFKMRKEEETDEPYTRMLQLYGGSGLLWIFISIIGLFSVLSKNTFAISASSLGYIALFNAIVGFAGYALRFYLIPKVDTIVFSALSFFGIVSAYILSYLFTGETLNSVQALGAAAIILANTVLINKENA